MIKTYLWMMLLIPLANGFIHVVFGGKGGKRGSDLRGHFTRLGYYAQVFTSIAVLFILEEPVSVTKKFVALDGYHYNLMFLVDHVAVYLGLLFSLVFLAVEKMSFHYLHAEEEHSKFYGLKSFFNFAVMAFVFSVNVDFLFFNWEIVGICSALLISYFYRRNQAVENSLFAFSVYRLCDAAFLIFAILLFYFTHSESVLTPVEGVGASLLGLLAFAAIMGKSGVYPLSSWLPLALEGPTPSSNLFYMSLSTHLGAVFLLKTFPVWSSSLSVKIVITVFGLVSFITSTLSARTQPNIKGALAYSGAAQVSLILVEIALGLHVLALSHLGFHMLYRLVQMSLSASVIDRRNFIERLSPELAKNSSHLPRPLFFAALGGFWSEVLIQGMFRNIARPFLWVEQLEASIINPEQEEPEEFEQAAFQRRME